MTAAPRRSIRRWPCTAARPSMIAQKFFRLSAKERRQVEAFLKSLTAPAPSELLARAAN